MLNNENNVPEIPVEHQIKINDKIYDKRSKYVIKDCFTDEYLHTEYSRYISLPIFKRLVFNNSSNLIEIDYEYGYTSHLNYKNALFQSNYERYSRVTSLAFKDEEAIEAFCKKYNFTKGKQITRCYFHKTCLSLDKREPYYFNNMVKKIDIYSLLNNQIELTPKALNTTEYSELQAHIFNKREEAGIESKSFRAFEGLKYTFGIELETVSGLYEDYAAVFKGMNVSSVFDGSLRDVDEDGNRIGQPWGAEYVTGVLKGDAGLNHVNKLTKILNERCTVDKRCAFHVHIGSLKWNSEEIVYCYLLGLALEKELFEMMPKSRRNNEYCKTLPMVHQSKIRDLVKANTKESYKKAITALYNQIFKIVSSKEDVNKPCADYNKKSGHPLGRHGGYNRETDHRYSWLNFTNIIFNQRGSQDSKTIEFRNHSGTLSYKKIHNWIKICMAFVEYVHNNKKEILNYYSTNKDLNLDKVLKSIYPKSSERLIQYVEVRKSLFAMDVNQDSDYIKDESNLKNIKEIICV